MERRGRRILRRFRRQGHRRCGVSYDSKRHDDDKNTRSVMWSGNPIGRESRAKRRTREERKLTPCLRGRVEAVYVLVSTCGINRLNISASAHRDAAALSQFQCGHTCVYRTIQIRASVSIVIREQKPIATFYCISSNETSRMQQSVLREPTCFTT